MNTDMKSFKTGAELGRSDVSLFLVDDLGVPCRASRIFYTLYFIDERGELLIGSPHRTPQNPSVGEYYVALVVPQGASSGKYRVRWTFWKDPENEAQTEFQDFMVEGLPSSFPDWGLSASKVGLLAELRAMLGDNDPNYRIWENRELLCYFEMVRDVLGSSFPNIGHLSLEGLCQTTPHARACLLWGAAIHGWFALSINWDDEDELSSGRTRQAESLKQNAEAQFDKSTEVLGLFLEAS